MNLQKRKQLRIYEINENAAECVACKLSGISTLNIRDAACNLLLCVFSLNIALCKNKTGRCNLILTVGNSYMFFNTENKWVYGGLNVMKGNYRIKSIHLTCHPPGFFYTKTSAATFGIF